MADLERRDFRDPYYEDPNYDVIFDVQTGVSIWRCRQCKGEHRGKARPDDRAFPHEKACRYAGPITSHQPVVPEHLTRAIQHDQTISRGVCPTCKERNPWVQRRSDGRVGCWRCGNTKTSDSDIAAKTENRDHDSVGGVDRTVSTQVASRSDTIAGFLFLLAVFIVLPAFGLMYSAGWVWGVSLVVLALGVYGVVEIFMLRIFWVGPLFWIPSLVAAICFGIWQESLAAGLFCFVVLVLCSSFWVRHQARQVQSDLQHRP